MSLQTRNLDTTGVVQASILANLIMNQFTPTSATTQIADNSNVSNQQNNTVATEDVKQDDIKKDDLQPKKEDKPITEADIRHKLQLKPWQSHTWPSSFSRKWFDTYIKTRPNTDICAQVLRAGEISVHPFGYDMIKWNAFYFPVGWLQRMFLNRNPGQPGNINSSVIFWYENGYVFALFDAPTASTPLPILDVKTIPFNIALELHRRNDEFEIVQAGGEQQLFLRTSDSDAAEYLKALIMQADKKRIAWNDKALNKGFETFWMVDNDDDDPPTYFNLTDKNKSKGVYIMAIDRAQIVIPAYYNYEKKLEQDLAWVGLIKQIWAAEEINYPGEDTFATTIAKYLPAVIGVVGGIASVLPFPQAKLIGGVVSSLQPLANTWANEQLKEAQKDFKPAYGDIASNDGLLKFVSFLNKHVLHLAPNELMLVKRQLGL